MNDPRRHTTIPGPLADFQVEAFPVNDDRALRDEIREVAHPGEWFNLNRGQRDALVTMVRDALERLARDPEAWLPDAVVARSNTKFGFFVEWLNGHLDDEVLRLRVAAERAEDDCVAELERIARGTL